MDEQLKKKLDELASIITEVQKKNDNLQKKYDGLDNEIVNKLSEKSSLLAEEIQAISKEKEEQKKRIDELEAILSRSPNGNKEQVKSAIEAYDEAVLSYIRSGTRIDSDVAKEGLKAMLTAPGIDEKKLEAKVMQVGINPDGGYWVRPDRLAKIVDRDFETSPVRSLADVITTASDHVEMIIDDDEATSGGWVSEISSRTSTEEPEIGLLSIYTHEQYAEPKITQQLLDDAGFDVAAWLQRKINSKIGRTENSAFVSGNGVNKPKGLLDYSAWAVAGTYERNKIEQVASGSAAALTSDGLIDLQNALHEVYQSNARFLMKRQSWGSIIKLKESGTGAYLIDPQMLRNGAGQLLLLGRPVVFASDMPAIAASALPVIYGDFRRGYTIVDKIGVTLIRDNITDKGRVKFYTSKRTGGAVTNFDSLKIQKVSA